jgi:hypothetical protein
VGSAPSHPVHWDQPSRGSSSCQTQHLRCGCSRNTRTHDGVLPVTLPVFTRNTAGFFHALRGVPLNPIPSWLARLGALTTSYNYNDPAGHAPHRLHRQPAHIQQFPHEIGFPDLPGFAIFPPTQVISGSWKCSAVARMFYEHLPLLNHAFRSESVMSRAPLCQELHIVSYSHSVSTIFASVLTPVDRQCVHLVQSLSAFRLEV